MTASHSQVSATSRPHGGCRGIHQHPPSRYSFNKTKEYQNQLQEDLEKLLEADHKANVGSPSWAVEASKLIHHGGQSQLFNKKLLAASKIERHLDSMGYGTQSRRPSASSQKSRPESSCSNQSSRPASHTHHKPNSAHQGLTETMLFDQDEDEGQFKFGRPTRTTLLRARHRCNSAPVNSYSIHKGEFNKNVSNIKGGKNRQATTLSNGLKSKLGSATEGQSIHSFLTGARYNRAHYYDAKCITDHGLYMPRSNPHAAFLMRPSSATSRDSEDSPPASPGSGDTETFLDQFDNHPMSASPVKKRTSADHVVEEEMNQESCLTPYTRNRPKSCKIRQRPKTVILSVDRRPLVTNKVNIQMQDHDKQKSGFKPSHFRLNGSYQSKDESNPYFQGVCIQGHSLSNGSTNGQDNKTSVDTSTKARITVKDISKQLRKENIILNGKQDFNQDSSIVLESPFDEYRYNPPTHTTEHRSCPSPVDMPQEELLNDRRFENSFIRTENVVPVLKGSRHRVASAKPKNSRVHFAEDLLSSKQSEQSTRLEDFVDDSDEMCASSNGPQNTMFSGFERDLSSDNDTHLELESLNALQDSNKFDNDRPMSRLEPSIEIMVQSDSEGESTSVDGDRVSYR